jgi:TolA-binding protein
MLYSQSPPLTAEETLFGGHAPDPDVRSDQRAGRRRVKPSVDSPYSYRFGEGQPAIGRPSIGKRMFRTLVRFSIAVLIGVGATLGWQSYGDEAKEMLVAQAPALGWVLPVSTTKSPVMAATSTDTTRQLAPLASTLDAMRRSVEQLAARQEQMAQNIAALRAAEENVRQKTSSTPPAPTPAPAPAQQAASIPQPKPPQPKIDSRLPPPAAPQFSR